jgi:very-short-patch-repair endonuclease
METTPSEITRKVHKEVTDSMKPFIQQMIDCRIPKKRMIEIINNHVNRKIKELYKSKSPFHQALDFLKEQAKDSKVESIFYDLLVDNQVSFKFQYQIGPYRVDYLIGDSLVIELDGPLHSAEKQKKHDENKDKYLGKMGYHVLRLPVYIVALDSVAVVNGIKEVING